MHQHVSDRLRTTIGPWSCARWEEIAFFFLARVYARPYRSVVGASCFPGTEPQWAICAESKIYDCITCSLLSMQANFISRLADRIGRVAGSTRGGIVPATFFCLLCWVRMDRRSGDLLIEFMHEGGDCPFASFLPATQGPLRRVPRTWVWGAWRSSQNMWA
ncbi:hypothetical protein CC86DRAFT_141092 [Ophiobolus disseminans]|uniref:Uncharacterized protein n=1 Tax=Ophiobolus disseminans TaxID=1469910 RepID=A0A6A7AEC6_9PLEO|nr:hypothetical protein CC86DRAFT_141092 [Ophiobolus disseminans]